MSESSEGAKRRARILLSAYAVDPTAGSEEMVGWQRSVEASRYFDTWVICEPDISKAGIDGHIAAEGSIPSLEFVYVPRTTVIRILQRVPGLFYLGYNLWHRKAYAAAQRLHASIGFDLVHQVNYVGYREPGYLWRLDTRFVWGPVGGTQNFPLRLIRVAGFVGGLREIVRSALNTVTLRFSRRVRLAAAKARPLWAANHTVARDLGRALKRPSIPVMLETGAPTSLEPNAPHLRTGPVQLLWAGECKAFKALPMLLDALATLPSHVDFDLAVVGDGPERHRWERHAGRLGLADRVRWLGWVPHREMVGHYRAADVFVFTSLRDTSGNVVLESFAQGVPVVAPDHQGAGDMVTHDCGILVPVTTSRAMVRAYQDAIVTLATDDVLLDRLRTGATERAAHYSWRRQGERMRDGYLGALADGAAEGVGSLDVSPRF